MRRAVYLCGMRWILGLVLLAAGWAARAQTVVCFGDSLTAGVGAPAGQAYPDFLRQDLAAAGYRANVVNDGVGGETTAEAMRQLPEVVTAHPAVVILELGVNDALRGVPGAETDRNLRAIVESLKKAHARVVVAGLDLRLYRGSNLPPGLVTPVMREFFGVNARVARAYGLAEIPFLLEGVYGVPGLMSPDYLHPNGAGYRKVAGTVLPYVEQALGKPPAISGGK